MPRRSILPILATLLLFLSSCYWILEKQGILSEEKLSAKDLNRIRSLKLLDKDEHIIKFYSNYQRKVAGNFYTDKRLAMYWLDEYHEEDRKVRSAFYSDIIAIDTTANVSSTYCPFLLVTQKDSTQFQVYVDGTPQEIKAFFEEAIQLWQKQKPTSRTRR